MKTAILDIEIFGMLDTIRQNHGISAIKWASACDIKHPARITELRIIFDKSKAGLDYSSVGRAFSIKKCQSLIEGLKFILGDNLVKKELLKLAEKCSDGGQRLLLLCLALNEEDQEQVELFLKALLKRGK